MQTKDTYSASGTFKVQWKSDGDLRVLDAPMIHGHNSFLVCANDKPIADLIDGADRITDEFFSRVGAIYRDQYMALDERAKKTVQFPEVDLEITVTGTLDPARLEWTTCTATLAATYVDLKGTTSKLDLKEDYCDLPAAPHPVRPCKTDECFVGWEINGHSDPNCEFGWTGCACNGTCCTHIVQWGRNCYNEKCAWGWLWLACGCHRNQIVPCPDCSGISPVA